MEHNHEDQKCECCENGIEAVIEKENELLKKHGWFVHFVQNDKMYPFDINIHTHGLKENYNHPDLQACIPIDQQSIHSILIDAIESNIKNGKTYEAGKRYNDLIVPSPKYEGSSYDVLFLEATEGGRTVLRMIFPDKDGSFEGKLGTEQIKGCIVPENVDLKAK